MLLGSLQTVDGQQQCRAGLKTRYTRQRMGRLSDTKVRGFMVTETNNEACARLQLVLALLLVALTLRTRPPHRLWAFMLSWSISIDSHKARSGR